MIPNTLFGGDFLGQILAANSLPGAFVHSRSRILIVIQASIKSTKINFLGPETARWGGGLPREGVVAETFVPSLESLCLPWVSKRGIWDIPGILPGCPGPLGVLKVCAEKVRAHFSFPRERESERERGREGGREAERERERRGKTARWSKRESQKRRERGRENRREEQLQKKALNR